MTQETTLTEGQQQRVVSLWSRIAQETLSVEEIGSALVTRCSELAALRLERKYNRRPDAQAFYSQNLGSWVFRLQREDRQGTPDDSVIPATRVSTPVQLSAATEHWPIYIQETTGPHRVHSFIYGEEAHHSLGFPMFSCEDAAAIADEMVTAFNDRAQIVPVLRFCQVALSRVLHVLSTSRDGNDFAGELCANAELTAFDALQLANRTVRGRHAPSIEHRWTYEAKATATILTALRYWQHNHPPDPIPAEQLLAEGMGPLLDNREIDDLWERIRLPDDSPWYAHSRCVHDESGLTVATCSSPYDAHRIAINSQLRLEDQRYLARLLHAELLADQTKHLPNESPPAGLESRLPDLDLSLPPSSPREANELDRDVALRALERLDTSGPNDITIDPSIVTMHYPEGSWIQTWLWVPRLFGSEKAHQ